MFSAYRLRSCCRSLTVIGYARPGQDVIIAQDVFRTTRGTWQAPSSMTGKQLSNAWTKSVSRDGHHSHLTEDGTICLCSVNGNRGGLTRGRPWQYRAASLQSCGNDGHFQLATTDPRLATLCVARRGDKTDSGKLQCLPIDSTAQRSIY